MEAFPHFLSRPILSVRTCGKKMRGGVLALALLAAIQLDDVLLRGARGCTILAVGKEAGGGSVFLAHTDDAGGGTQVLHRRTGAGQRS